ncbi:type II secretion system protein [Hippea jasoniae]|uniref:type II secretion system protein n=1 Tax=Hippea jasoniae TaxID=944479 RepID=UPI00054E4029|nr:prepilin-type N-terminal cleavage/methylation domain-containing protein [Hippea jasoniae]
MKRKGFTLIEVAIVLVILGLIIGLGIPMLRMLVKQNKLTQDRTLVKEAKEALIGYAFAHGGFPAPVNKNGYRTLPASKLGVPSRDAEGQSIIYDVNDTLTDDATGGNLTTFCNNVKSAISSNQKPQIQYSDGTKKSVAFVVISRGSNYKLDDLNSNAAKWTNGTRIYDSDDHPYSKDYDDIVVSYSLGELNNWCLQNIGESSSGGLGGFVSNLANFLNKYANANKAPDSGDVNLPSGYSYSKQGKRRAVIEYSDNGKTYEATVSWKISGGINEVDIKVR